MAPTLDVLVLLFYLWGFCSQVICPWSSATPTQSTLLSTASSNNCRPWPCAKTSCPVAMTTVFFSCGFSLSASQRGTLSTNRTSRNPALFCTPPPQPPFVWKLKILQQRSNKIFNYKFISRVTVWN